MEFGLMFFSSCHRAEQRYRLLMDAARFADRHDFCCVWTPERHFHQFGGLFPNPSVTSAALAMITENVQIRAGSLISPLHDPVRVAEDWSVVDNLSGGRVAISFGSGWNVDDFIFFPDRYASRQAVMFDQIETIKALWRGCPVLRTNSYGKPFEVKVYPEPLQKELPIWITSSGNVETFVSAGKIGANVLTHLIGQNVDALAVKIRRYREALEEAGFPPDSGKVSLMLHTFLGQDVEKVKKKVRGPFRSYLSSAISLEERAAIGGGAISGGHNIDPHEIPGAVMEELLDLTFERYFHSAALMGTPASCADLVWLLQGTGVDEIACLVDFIDDPGAVMESLQLVDTLRASFCDGALENVNRSAVAAFTEDLGI